MNKLILLFAICVLFIAYGCTPEENPEPTASPAPSNAATVEFAESAKAVTPLLTGTQIPNGQLRTTSGDTVQLMNLVSEQPTVFIFYRGGWCPYCNKHMAELQQAQSKLTEMGYRILAISPDSPEYLQKSVSEHNLGYTLLSDSPMEVTSAFGLAYKVDQETVDRYKENGLDLANRSGYDHYLLPVPAVFLVDTNGMIRFQYVNPDYTTRINKNVLLTAAEEYYPETTS
ncbi:AhpC/TSA family protein [Aliifodinibius sp. S!AR15-10]|uniref:peroxiredoxin-like family protein n=1 Tax=Aliifodinibius sp. S!AR15-10 TaxID=2950437 RepID=UPI00285B1BCF|nr:peroxiredoxin-like family protein [Aliifodinibius sp. S!AR15-10]MDR8393285.1 AhpC/TSA family protein [Aliifodinibius sp. S!AR15-10]